MTPAGSIYSGGPLAGLGSEALHLFHEIRETLDGGTTDGWKVDPFMAEAERFKLWSANLGLFVPGHGSLDYRVREAERLGQTLESFLQDLITSLRDVISIHNGTFQRSEDQGEVASEYMESEEEDEDCESTSDILLDGIRDPIDKLFKMATRIRSPSARFGSLRAAKYQQIDKDTGKDFLQVTIENDRDYVGSIFLQHEKSRVCQASDPTPPAISSMENDDEVWEPIRTVLYHQRSTFKSFLVDRIAHANVRRRQPFAYWARRREKHASYTHTSLSQDTSEIQLQPTTLQVPQEVNRAAHLPPKPAPTVTTATTLNAAQIEAIENRSTWTVSEYAQSTWQPDREKVDFPSPPKRHFGAGFECPYCFTICSRETLAEKAWKAHLIHDLRP